MIKHTSATNTKTVPPSTVSWINAASGRVPLRGLAWPHENGGSFSRLPLRAHGQVRDALWELAQQPAGAHLAFRSDCSQMHVRVELGPEHPLLNMCPTGSRGMELFCGPPYDMRSWAIAVPDLTGEPRYERTLFSDMLPCLREYRLYLPLYCAVKQVEIGLNTGARILRPSPPRLSRPIVFYGTSITQGGSADTPGSDYVAIIGRRINTEVINLGFSGNGWGDAEMADLCAEIDASIFVLAYSENTQAEDLSRTLPAFIKTLRQKHPQTPILLASNVRFGHYGRDPLTRKTLELRRDVVFGCYSDLRRQGDYNTHLVDGFGLIHGGDGVFTDGIHPTSLGFALLADRLGEAIREILFAEPSGVIPPKDSRARQGGAS